MCRHYQKALISKKLSEYKDITRVFIKPIITQEWYISGVFKLSEDLFPSEREVSEKREVSIMCYLSKDVEENGIILSIRNLMATMRWSV